MIEEIFNQLNEEMSSAVAPSSTDKDDVRDGVCKKKYGKLYTECTPENKKEIDDFMVMTESRKKRLAEHIDIMSLEEADIESEQPGLSVMWDGTPFIITIERQGEGQVDTPEILSFLRNAMVAEVERGDVYYEEEKDRAETKIVKGDEEDEDEENNNEEVAAEEPVEKPAEKEASEEDK